MLKDERFNRILELLEIKNPIKTHEISEELGISLATVRRDLNEMHDNKQIIKVFGGAKKNNDFKYETFEKNMHEKRNLHINEKELIAKYAASKIKDDELIYIDAGTTCEAMLKYIDKKNITIVTNSVDILYSEYAIDKQIYVVPGKLKKPTNSIIGSMAYEYILKFNFTKGFFGTNGISRTYGFTTPNNNEASIKEIAIKNSNNVYVLADSSKFDTVSKVAFTKDENINIISCKNDKAYEIKFKEV